MILTFIPRFLWIDWLYVFRGQSFPLHFGVSVAGFFFEFAVVAFLPPPRSPAKNMREPRSPPLLSHWKYEATPPITLRENNRPLNSYDLFYKNPRNYLLMSKNFAGYFFMIWYPLTGYFFPALMKQLSCQYFSINFYNIFKYVISDEGLIPRIKSHYFAAWSREICRFWEFDSTQFLSHWIIS